MVLPTCGNISPDVCIFPTTSDNFGKVRLFPATVGSKLLNNGAVRLLAASLGAPLGNASAEASVSYSSQMYVKFTSSASVAEPVSSKGVPLGTVKLLGIVTTGGVFPTDVVTSQVVELIKVFMATKLEILK